MQSSCEEHDEWVLLLSSVCHIVTDCPAAGRYRSATVVRCSEPLFERAVSLLLRRRGGGGGGSGGGGLRGVDAQGLVQLAGALAARGEPCDALFEVSLDEGHVGLGRRGIWGWGRDQRWQVRFVGGVTICAVGSGASGGWTGGATRFDYRPQLVCWSASCPSWQTRC